MTPSSLEDCGIKTFRRVLTFISDWKFTAEMTLSSGQDFTSGRMFYSSDFDLTITHRLTKEEMDEQIKREQNYKEPRIRLTYKGEGNNVEDSCRASLQAFLDDQLTNCDPDFNFPTQKFSWKRTRWHIEAPNEDHVKLLEQIITEKVGRDSSKIIHQWSPSQQ